jgi:inorganic pyrophosphatase
MDIIEVVIETPKESRVKFKRSEQSDVYILDRILPPGLRFPFNYGFVPNTRAEDGDPTDVILILDEPLFPGCRVKSKIIGVLKAKQTESGKTNRNDRLVAVPILDTRSPALLEDLPQDFADDVERFFATYHRAEGNEFKLVGIGGVEEGMKLVKNTQSD